MSGWMDLVAAYLQYEAADKASNKKPQYSISPQQSWLFDKLKDLMNYSPTRDYVSSYADSYLKGMNAPNGSLNWKPTFQSDYMKGQQPLPNMSVDLSKLPIFQGDKNGQMPWNPNYTGAGIGGKPTVPGAGTKTTQPFGGRGMLRPGFQNTVGAGSGDWSQDYYNNSFNGGSGYGGTNPNSPDYAGPKAPNGAGTGEPPRNEYGQLIDSMNNTNFADVVHKNADGTVSLSFPGMPQPSTLSAQQWAQLQSREAAFKQFFATNMQKITDYAKANKMDIFRAALLLFGL